MKTIRLSLVLVLGAVLAACGSDGGGDSSSASAAKGIDAANKIIRIGALNGESGPAAAIGKPYAVGKRILVEQVNAEGSNVLPDGWKLELVERDHGYNPQRSVQLFNEIRDDVLFIATSFGTPNTLPLRPMLKRNQVVAYPASLSSKMAEFEYTPPVGPSYIVEAQRAMDWAVESFGGADAVKAGVIYQQDDYGKDGYDGWKLAALHHNVKIVAEATYAPGQADYTAAVATLKEAGATHVMLVTLPSATGPILGAAKQLDYGPIWIGNTPSWIDRFFDPAVIPPEVFDSYFMVSGLPYWAEPTPGMDEFLALYEEHGKAQSPPDSYILMSYLQGRVAVEALRRMISSGDMTRAGYLKAVQSISGYDLDGAVQYEVDLSSVPYIVGVETRVLKPDFNNRTWKVAADFAAPQSRVVGK